MINKDRLSKSFCDLVKIDSISREEKTISEYLQVILKELGAEIYIDKAGDAVGGDTGNLVAKFKGTVDAPAMMLCGHMDTVEPGRGIVPVFENGVFTSKGNTILGADDKSALAIIIEVMNVIRENTLPHGPIEVVFTICEEIGLLGAKHFDFSLMDSSFGYILDSTDRKGIVTRAPYSTHFDITVLGKAAHAGAEPEKGVSAILLAAKALASVPWGRIDPQTTCNVGKISGGVATNIVAEEARVTGEVRSHSKQKMDDIVSGIRAAFETVINEAVKNSPAPGRPQFDMAADLDFPGTHIPDDHPVIRLAVDAAKSMGIDLQTKTSGGGADANIFTGKGLITGVLGTGMTAAHTLEESIALDDMVNTTTLLLACIRRHSEAYSA
ncbi:MAG: M20/M25/M40 family metallo-hydrolase [Proteobacteria bacterium]|nr:M20/M25/M40 family metallo-hydrolase [Pseudomonadota bacterium]